MPFNFEVMEKLSANISKDRDVTLLATLTQGLLHMMAVGDPNSLTSADVRYLTQMVEKDWTPLLGAAKAKAGTADVMVSVATSYVKMASLMLEPRSVDRWADSAEGVRGYYVCNHRGKGNCLNPGAYLL